MSPRANLSHYQSDVHQIIFDQLAATYFLFAFNQAVVLRVAGEGQGGLRVWRVMLAGMLLCDLVHLWGTTKALGGLGALLAPAGWRFYDWVNVVMLILPIVLRGSFLAGWGVSEAAEGAGAAPAQAVTPGRQTRSKTKIG